MFIFMDRISSQKVEEFGGLRISFLLIAVDVVLLAPSDGDV